MRAMYSIIEGKHTRPDGTVFRAGDPPEAMDSEEAKRFPNKFKLLEQPVLDGAQPAPEGDGGDDGGDDNPTT